MSSGRLDQTLLVLFVASGFAGLVYQSIWTQYHGLTLGHAAHAQTLVLGIFMGGMALGAWWVGERGTQWRNLLRVYAWVELAIGVAGLAFHPVFVAYSDFSRATVYPALADAAAHSWQWGSAALLIAPQSILLGSTFPLMCGAYLRVAPRGDARILGGLYFSNSLGAAIGALAATFLLLPAVGMPGTVAVAGALNLAVAAAAWQLSRQLDTLPERPAVPAPESASIPAAEARITGPRTTPFLRWMLVAAAVTGASSFVYEISWVRMLSQALGTTVHAFELMLAAFILGLALGGLWVRHRSDRAGEVIAAAGYAQVCMGIAALLSIPVFAQSFRWVGAMVTSLPKTEAGYALFNLGSGAIAIAVMLPAAFFAGMTLPLFTTALLRRGHGESSIGRVYAANTLGAIVGVVLAVHVLIPWLGLRVAVIVAAVADIVLGIVLLRSVAAMSRPAIGVAAGAAAVVLGAVLMLGGVDPRSLASGVFRTGDYRLRDDTRILYLRDGKTATTAVFTQADVGTIATNGKPEASLQLTLAPPDSADEVTMIMVAALPLAIHPAPENIAIIGWGSGLTTHTLLGSPAPRRVDAIEIEPTMHEAARLFGSRVERAYRDPRLHIHFDDARTYFSIGDKHYDAIVSEPSNPWVGGVATLFTRQFYRFAGDHLAPGGLLVQWLQTYELDDDLLATMLAALATEFPYVDLYLINSADLVLVSSRSPLPPLDASRLASPELARELQRVGLDSSADYEVRRIGSQRLVRTLVRMADAVPHSDFHPVVTLKAPMARFIGRSASRIAELASLGMPLLELTDGRPPLPASAPMLYSPHSIPAQDQWIAVGVRDSLRSGSVDRRLIDLEPAVLPAVRTLLQPGVDEREWLAAAADVAEHSIARLSAGDLRGAWIEPAWINPDVQSEPVRRVLAAYAAAARRDPEAMRSAGLAAIAVLDRQAPPLLRDQMLLIALLGAEAQGGAAGMRDVERAANASLAEGGPYALAGTYLRAWAELEDGH